jgi:GT2 family glycosyltransferase
VCFGGSAYQGLISRAVSLTPAQGEFLTSDVGIPAEAISFVPYANDDQFFQGGDASDVGCIMTAGGAPGRDYATFIAQHLLGACMLVRREVWDALGGMDEKYFLFLEETDFCFRAAQIGWRCAFVRTARITHLGEQSLLHIVGQSGGLYIRSYNRFCRKFRLGLPKLVAVNAILILGVLAGCAAAMWGRDGLRKSLRIIRALWFGYLRPPPVQKAWLDER